MTIYQEEMQRKAQRYGCITDYDEADQLLLPARAEGAGGGEVADGLQKVGLAVGVAADEQVHARHKADIRLGIVAKIPQNHPVNPHF